MGRLFGTDGARGVANIEISCTLAMDIGRAAAMVVARDRAVKRPVFLLGHDTRISHGMLCSALAAGLCSVGADVITLGTVPTPAVAYLVANSDADAAIMLSASHNPYEFNGIKIFGADGFKLTDEEEEEIEAIVLDHAMEYDLKSNADLGTIRNGEEMVERYIDHIASSVQEDLSGIKIAADCANGSASATAAKIFGKLGAQVTILNDQPDGININENCGSTHIEQLADFVKKLKYYGGVAFDGDADRCLAVDEQGNLIDGDKIIAALAMDMKEKGELDGNAAVVTVMSNLGFFRFCEQNGITPVSTKVGDRYVLEEMVNSGYAIGGEQSGHIIFRHHATTGDGQMSAVKLLAMAREKGVKLSRIGGMMERYPQVIINVKADAAQKAKYAADKALAEEISKANASLGRDGRVLVRVSGTEPLLRIMVEGREFDAINDLAVQLGETIKAAIQ